MGGERGLGLTQDLAGGQLAKGFGVGWVFRLWAIRRRSTVVPDPQLTWAPSPLGAYVATTYLGRLAG
jgi:hypothetical protein